MSVGRCFVITHRFAATLNKHSTSCAVL
jgi:hypothetical protein